MDQEERKQHKEVYLLPNALTTRPMFAEFYSIIRAVKAMDEADVCFIVIDAHKGVTGQDITIFSLAARKGKGVVVLVNKWDLVEKETNTARDYEKNLKQKLAPFTDVPILFVSAKEKTRIFKAIEHRNRPQP